MTMKTKLILSATLVALISTPASARIDGDEGIQSSYAFFGKERSPMTNNDVRNLRGHFVNRPFQQR